MPTIPVRAQKRAATRTSVAILIVCLLPLLIKLFYYPHNIGSDDSYIHLQVARNIATGQGWGVNPGVSVNVSTSPLFTLVVAALDLIAPSHVAVLAQAISALAAIFGLLLVYLRTRFDTGLDWAAFVAAFSLACSCNLWRWNADVMEATLGFFWVALVLFLFGSRRASVAQCLLRGFVLGLAVLTRPEMALMCALCFALTAVFDPHRWRSLAGMIAGFAIPVTPWVLFCEHLFGKILPTTFYAKATTYLIFWNPIIPRQFAWLIAESFLWPALLFAVILAIVRFKMPRPVLEKALLPAGLLLGIGAFYYLRTPALESTGRYLLPFFPCAGYLLGLLLPVALVKLQPRALAWLVGVAMLLHLVTSLAINQIYIAPTLKAFQSEYRAAMADAADYLVAHTQPSDRVLIHSDIGVVSYEARGRFVIADGGALASPELRGLTVPGQIQVSKPRYLLESFGISPGDLAPLIPGLKPVWSRRFKQHGLAAALDVPYWVSNIYLVERP